MNFKRAILFGSLIILSLSFYSLSSQVKMYIYIDGSNNVYTITKDSINYDPITPIESSSGEYSGGEPKKVQISEQQFLRIELLIKSILSAKEIHIKNREMGCGTLIVGKKTIYFNSSSQQKTDLENELKTCLD